MRTVALIGNGSSIAYNELLAVPVLTRDLLVKFQAAGGDLAAIASGVDAESPTGFEDLLGPFDSVARLLGALPGLAETPFAQRLEILDQAATAGRELYREGVSVALDMIATRSHGQTANYTRVERLCHAVSNLGPASNLTVATLNYDGLLHSGFLQTYADFDGSTSLLEISDMGDGRTPESMRRIQTDFSDGSLLDAAQLRSVPDFMDDRAWILNLHGSLGWLRRGFEEYRKFRIDDLRTHEYWKKLLSGDTEWEPVVVLTNQKDGISDRFPFSVAYDAFRAQLITADRWLVVGYGLGDEPVNATFRLASLARDRAGLEPPQVLVVGREDESILRGSASSALGVKLDQITATGAGLPDALDSAEWARWAR